MSDAYIESHCTLRDSFTLATRWIGGRRTSLIAPSTSAVEAQPWLTDVQVSIGTIGNRHSRFAASPRGIVIAWCLNLVEVLDLEGRRGVESVVLVQAHKPHAPWVTARNAEHLGGEAVPAVPESDAATKAFVKGISSLAVHNQGLTDSRERSAAVQGLTYLRDHAHALHPAQLVVEALRNDWPGSSPVELAKIAKELNAGKQLRYQRRLNPEAMGKWLHA